MSTATARYIIAADDQTKAAIAAVRNGFKSMEKDVKATARGMNLAISAIAGTNIIGLFRKSIQATAASNVEFARSLDNVKNAFTELITMRTGIAGLTKEMDGLAATLRDPEVKRGVDGILGSIVKLGAMVVKGWGLIGAGVIDIKEKFFPSDIQESDLGWLKRYTEYTEQIRKNIEHTNFQKFLKVAEEIEKFSSTATSDAGEAVMGSVRETLADQEAVVERWRRFHEETEEASKKSAEEVSKWKEKVSTYADEAARNMQDALANFLFDPFSEGLDGMLRGFIDVIKRMVAELVSSKIFDWLKGGAGGGAFGKFLGGVGSLFGFASGGSFKVGGSGGTDSQTVAFRATPGEIVDVRTPGQARGGAPVVNLSIVQNNPTSDAMKMLPALVQHIQTQAAELARAMVRDDLSRGAIR